MTHELSSNQGWAEAGKIIRQVPEKKPTSDMPAERDAELQKRRQGKKGPVMIPDLRGRD